MSTYQAPPALVVLDPPLEHASFILRFLNYDACLLAKFVYIIANSVDPDEMSHNAAFICAFTVCQSTCWQVGIWQVSRMKRLTILKLKVHFILPIQISFFNVILHPPPFLNFKCFNTFHFSLFMALYALGRGTF